ncbi:MAG TPA: O-acetyl-ADP-ribose deacetylase [Clostridia bacterium]|jgi:O-acetyl-ADP-ribose deacetylase (regulator of RNase III)/transcriptional regulator with XRE-family HTH domain|nr:O-acetyl-ADP-ribose deacetylase [Clostridia bacterium]
MSIKLIRGDITRIKVDAIVNAANRSLLGGGGVDGAIHYAAGPELLEECKMLGGCKVGQAKITRAYNLPAKYVIHTVGPIWRGGNKGEEQLLTNCYINSLELASKYKVATIAFPLISSGAYGYPKDKAIRVAMNAFKTYLLDNDIDIFLVLYSDEPFKLPESLSSEIDKYIAEYLDEQQQSDYERPMPQQACFYEDLPKLEDDKNLYSAEIIMEENLLDDKLRVRKMMSLRSRERRMRHVCAEETLKLDDVMNTREETFSERLLKLIDQKGMTDVEVYKRANIDRRLFSKIRISNRYTPSKKTALALAIALSLDLDETIDLIGRAGYTLSNVLKFDIIIRFFIEKGNYDIFDINEVLFAYDLPLLGC